MTSRKLAAATAGSAAAILFATTAFAQTPAAPAVTHGAAVPGICFLSTQEALASSTVGKHVNTRIQQLAQVVEAELKPEQTIIENESKTLESSRTTMDQATLQKRATDLQTRFGNFQRKAELRRNELAATQQKAVTRVLQEMDPIAKQQYQARRCAILLDRESVMLGNPAMDLTQSVIQGLNARIQTFTIERERLDQQAAAPAAR
jgi:Skp family chaperone for outer membrane proteins